jgi:hypothetical protein
MYVCMYVFKYVCIYVCMYVYVFIYRQKERFRTKTADNYQTQQTLPVNVALRDLFHF